DGSRNWNELICCCNRNWPFWSGNTKTLKRYYLKCPPALFLMKMNMSVQKKVKAMADVNKMPKKKQQEIVNKVWEDYRYALDAKRDLHKKWARYEDYYKANQWKYKKVDPQRVKPVVNYIFTTIESMMPYLTSNVPDPVVLPVQPDDEEIARDLTKIVKIILEKNKIRDVLQLAERARLK